MLKRVIPMLAILIVPAFFVAAQVSDDNYYEKIEADQYEVSGKALPKYYVIMGFLSDGYSVYEKSLGAKTLTRPRFDKFLRDLGIGTDSKELTAVALRDAAIELQERTFDFDLLDQPDAFRADQDVRLKAQARNLGEIYGGLLASFLDSGMTHTEIATIDERIDAKYRPRFSLFWKLKPGASEPSQSYLVRSQEFETAANRYYDTQTLADWSALPRTEK